MPVRGRVRADQRHDAGHQRVRGPAVPRVLVDPGRPRHRVRVLRGSRVRRRRGGALRVPARRVPRVLLRRREDVGDRGAVGCGTMLLSDPVRPLL